jgi:alpha-beta hydrolase superfamily lysophospholipase
MGGNIALDYRVRGRLSCSPCAYIISSPWIGLVNKVPKPVYLTAKMISRVKPDFRISANIIPQHLGNPEIINAERRTALVHNSISVETAVDGIDIGKALEEGRLHGGSGSEKPMLLMHSKSDMICNVENTRKFAALEGDGCTYIEWQDLFHEIHNGNKEKDGSEVIETVIAWIRNLPGLSD